VDLHKTLYHFYTTKEMTQVSYGNNHEKCASLAAIARTQVYYDKFTQ